MGGSFHLLLGVLDISIGAVVEASIESLEEVSCDEQLHSSGCFQQFLQRRHEIKQCSGLHRQAGHLISLLGSSKALSTMSQEIEITKRETSSFCLE